MTPMPCQLPFNRSVRIIMIAALHLYLFLAAKEPLTSGD